MIGGLVSPLPKKLAMRSRVIGHGGVCALWREIICRHWQKNGIDYVLIARHDTATANWQDMAKGLQKAIRYLHRTIANGTNSDAKSDAKPSSKPMADSQPQDDP
jgi:hypothetical protein